MCRFATKDSQIYDPVEKAIQEVCFVITQNHQAASGKATANNANNIIAHKSQSKTYQSDPNSLEGRMDCCPTLPEPETDMNQQNFAATDIRKRQSDSDDRKMFLFLMTRSVRRPHLYPDLTRKPSTLQDLEGDTILISFTGQVQKTLQVPLSLSMIDIPSLLRHDEGGMQNLGLHNLEKVLIRSRRIMLFVLFPGIHPMH